MRQVGERRLNPELREVVVEASLALARLDAERLEELALSCQALNRELSPSGAAGGEELARQARDAAREMAVFGRVLAATQANLDVMARIRELRQARLEYGGATQASGRFGRGHWALMESGHGDH